MKTFTKPKNLNGTELMDELLNVDIHVKEIFDNADGTISFETDLEEKAAKVVAKHNGTIIAPDKSVQRQAIAERLGLTADELQVLLG